ncbi:MAG: hypothetical protein ACOZAJ_04500 [Patescibacteria group bacterium]
MQELYKLNHEKHTFVQGDQDPQPEMKEAALTIGESLKNKGWQANVGAYGGFVKVFEQSGIKINPHEMVADGRTNKFDEQTVEAVNCADIAKELFKNENPTDQQVKDTAWALRMGLFLANSKSFIFFPGTKGTRAHLLSTLAFNLTSDKPKPIALVGWEENQPDLINKSKSGLEDQEEAWLKTFAKELQNNPPTWLKKFSLNEIEAITDFVTSEQKLENN